MVLIHGARQVGKTTLVHQMLRAQGPPTGPGGPRYFTLDSAAVLAAAQGDPEGFIAALAPHQPIAIDEVQRVPALFPAIKAVVDRDRRPGRFLLTGSANVLTLPSISESMAGRMEIVRLWPLSQGELEGAREGFIDRLFADTLSLPTPPRADRASLWARIQRGGFPEAVARTRPERRAAWFDSYITTILQRDVRDLANVEDLAAMPRLLRLLASRIGGLLNHADLSRSLSLPRTTLARYFSLLEATFLVHLAPAWSSNKGLRLIKSPKVYLLDTGLACHLHGIDALSEADAALGPLLENFVAVELLKQAGWARTRTEPHHFRTSAGREVDLVLEDRRGRVVGVEVKAGATVGKDDFKGLRALADAAGDRFLRGVVLHTGQDPVPFGPDLHALPLTSLWAAP